MIGQKKVFFDYAPARKKCKKFVSFEKRNFLPPCWRNNSQTDGGRKCLDERAPIPEIDSQHLHRLMNSLGFCLAGLRIGARIDRSRQGSAHARSRTRNVFG
jgi:hypothetical protein